nr:heparinase II/III family protein [Romboutsia sp. Marseille-P6047]
MFGYKKVHFDKFINWEDEKMGRSYLRRLNGHEFLGDLIEAYRETKEEKYLSVGLELVYQWIDKYENEYDIEYRNKYDYHDETTALRMNYWVNFILNCYNLFRREYLERFVSNISKTAELLSNENFHNKNTNHGMYQDLSLLLYSQIFT